MAFAAIAVATGIKLAVGRFMVEDAEVMFLAAVAVAAWFGGARGGMTAVGLSSLSQAYFFIEPVRTLRFERTADLLQLGAWVLESSLLVLLIDARDRANARATAHATQVERIAQALTRSNERLLRESEVRARAEVLLRASDETNRLLFEASPFPMFVVDDETRRFVDVNRAALALYRYNRPQFLALPANALMRPGELPPASAPLQINYHRTSAGESLRVEVSSRTVQLRGRSARLVAAKDVTERDRFEQQVRHSQKMKAVGQLAGGVAHDFNNLLFIILGYTATLLEDRDPTDPDVECLVEIKKAAERSADLTKQLLLFSRQEPQTIVPLDLSLATTRLKGLLTRLVTTDIALVTDLAEDLPPTKMDPGQFEQVLMNLVVNARHATPAGGEVRVETRAIVLDAAYAEKNPGVLPGRYVRLAICDNGVGMDKKTVARIFEPFFTTKEQGKGTGLGLAIVFGIIEECGGHLRVYSEPGRGTTFHLLFPAGLDPTSVAPEPEAADEPLAGIETVLVVEDEDQVRDLVRRVLEKRGYRVLTAPKPSEALAIAERDIGSIDLVLTDVMMPEMNGRKLADELRLLRPELNVLFMSGFTDAVMLDEEIVEGAPPFLQKPMTPGALIAGVRRALDGHVETLSEAAILE